MYDMDRVSELVGIVQEITISNPHSRIVLSVAMASGALQVVSLEGPAMTVLRTRGFTENAMKYGDRVTVKIHPLKDGSLGGTFFAVVLPDGRMIG